MTIKYTMPSILVIDDDADCNELISSFLHADGFEVLTTVDPAKAIDLLQLHNFGLVIIDIKIPKISGFDIIKHIKQNYKNLPVIILTANSTVQNALKSEKMSAIEYLEKPFSKKEITDTVKKIFQTERKKNPALENQFNSFHGIIGSSILMQEVYKTIIKASKTKATVLISGESGTGKELAARAIHYDSPEVQSPFIPVNCGGIPENLLESELFGYKKGAFTGANDTREGFFQTANNGTIFLDEISETSFSMQVKLLRVIQEKQFFMIGSRTPQNVNVRIIAATNTDLENLIKLKLFREDLFYRLNVIRINLPPLRNRENDITTLIHYFIKKYSEEFKKKPPLFVESAFNALKKYLWPGNIRELENMIQRLILMADEDIIDIPALPEHLRFSTRKSTTPFKTLQEIEQDYIQLVLKSVDNNKTQAARILGITRKTLWDKLKKINIPV